MAALLPMVFFRILICNGLFNNYSCRLIILYNIHTRPDYDTFNRSLLLHKLLSWFLKTKSIFPENLSNAEKEKKKQSNWKHRNVGSSAWLASYAACAWKCIRKWILKNIRTGDLALRHTFECTFFLYTFSQGKLGSRAQILKYLFIILVRIILQENKNWTFHPKDFTREQARLAFELGKIVTENIS